MTTPQPIHPVRAFEPAAPAAISAGLAPQSRYVLPSFVERTSYGIKEMNPYNKLFEERIIFLGVQIDDASANDVMAQLLTLEAIDRTGTS
jgi:ATP-dependent Clp protease protease subunit